MTIMMTTMALTTMTFVQGEMKTTKRSTVHIIVSLSFAKAPNV